jgi:mannose-6-phosphate isomerase-like protein (cupin superfamily)
MVVLRAALLGPFRDESSFLFLVEGRGRRGMGLHHDGDVDAFWLQLEGRRTVAIGPPVRPGTPQDIAGPPPEGDPRWTTLDLRPGTLFYLPPRTPHEVICRSRSLALSLTWGPPPASSRRRSASARAASLTAWDVVSGRVTAVPRASRTQLWTQVPVAVARSISPRRACTLLTPDGGWRCPAAVGRLARRLAFMPTVRRDHVADTAALSMLIESGVLTPHEIPQRIMPDDLRALDGWEF